MPKMSPTGQFEIPFDEVEQISDVQNRGSGQAKTTNGDHALAPIDPEQLQERLLGLWAKQTEEWRAYQAADTAATKAQYPYKTELEQDARDAWNQWAATTAQITAIESTLRDRGFKIVRKPEDIIPEAPPAAEQPVKKRKKFARNPYWWKDGPQYLDFARRVRSAMDDGSHVRMQELET